jgi:DNA mismatch repair protein MutS
LRHAIHERLRRAPDLARALARLTLSRGGPRDLGTVREALATASDLRERLQAASSLEGELVFASRELAESSADLAGLRARLNAVLAHDLPLLARDGGFVCAGANPELDELRLLRDESKRVIVALETRYRSETGISSLKIRHNNILGYYVEATPSTAAKLQQPHSPKRSFTAKRSAARSASRPRSSQASPQKSSKPAIAPSVSSSRSSRSS